MGRSLFFCVDFHSLTDESKVGMNLSDRPFVLRLQVDKMQNAVCLNINRTPARLSPLESITWISKRTLQKRIGKTLSFGVLKMLASLVITFMEAPLSNNQKPESTQHC